MITASYNVIRPYHVIGWGRGDEEEERRDIIIIIIVLRSVLQSRLSHASTPMITLITLITLSNHSIIA